MKLLYLVHSVCLSIALTIPITSHATLLGLSPELPNIDFSGSGIIEYNANNGIVRLSADPSTLFSIDPFIFTPILGTGANSIKSLNIQFQVDSLGNVITSNPTIPDLILKGEVDANGDDVPDYAGTLLTAEVIQFGYQNDISNGDDVFDLRLNFFGGSLSPFYSNQDMDIAVRIISESSTVYNNPFNNSFTSSWQGQAKGVLGLTPSAPHASVPITSPLWLWISLLPVLFPPLRRAK